MTRTLLSALALCVLVGCDETSAPATAPQSEASPLTHAEADSEPATSKLEEAILAFLDSPDTTVDVLDIDVGLDVRAAERIVRHRDGRDRTWGTEDDDPIDTMAELTHIDFVGDASVGQLADWIDHLEADGALVDGVAFTDEEAAMVVSLANIATFDELDVDLALDVRAAQGIVDTRPFLTIDELALVPYVGPATLEHLRAAATAKP